MESNLRKIIHIDMDAFYASVEQRDHVEYRGKPLIVGGSPHSRGVVATCSYEARRYGIHSAMPASMAHRLCPHAIFVKPRMDVYRQVSRDIMSICKAHTDLVEPLSLDEAFLDVTHHRRGMASGTLIAREIKQQIYEVTGLTASAGVSYNKLIAKIASDDHKPNGLTVITPEKAQAFLDAVPIGRFFGIGKVTEQKLSLLGVHTGSDLRRLSREQLIQLFSDRGRVFYDLVRGIDPRPVLPNRIRQSIGKETTFQVDMDDIDDMLSQLMLLAQTIEQQLRNRSVTGRVVVLKIKFANFQQITRRTTTHIPVQSAQDIYNYVQSLLNQVYIDTKVRLLGITVQKLESAQDPLVQMEMGEQLTLF
ncbi:MAG: DNA polymerase IV [Acidibacillus sp.]|nr:DNA polymerase IV [Acidibacillus sp.]